MSHHSLPHRATFPLVVVVALTAIGCDVTFERSDRAQVLAAVSGTSVELAAPPGAAAERERPAACFPSDPGPRSVGSCGGAQTGVAHAQCDSCARSASASGEGCPYLRALEAAHGGCPYLLRQGATPRFHLASATPSPSGACELGEETNEPFEI